MPDKNESRDDELEEKLRRAFGEDASEGLDLPKEPAARFSAPDVPDTTDLDQRMKAANRSASSFQANRQKSQDDIEKRRRTERADARGLGIGLQIAYTIIGLPLLGFGAGALVDYATHALFWKGVLGLIGCILAIGVAIMLINQANSQG